MNISVLGTAAAAAPAYTFANAMRWTVKDYMTEYNTNIKPLDAAHPHWRSTKAVGKGAATKLSKEYSSRQKVWNAVKALVSDNMSEADAAAHLQACMVRDDMTMTAWIKGSKA